LTGLYLDSNQLTSIAGIGKLVNLTSLCLNSNKLTSLADIGQLVNLTDLYLNVNQLTSVAGIGKLVNLTSLCLNSNKLTSLADIGQLVNLTKLYVTNTKLTSIVGIEYLVNLKTLCIEDSPQLKSLIRIYKLTESTYVRYDMDSLAPVNKLNLIKYIEKNKFNNFNYWQLCRKFPRHFKFSIFHILKELVLTNFKHELRKNNFIKDTYPII
jgi:Leucine-rich repeat (LRR) protein